MRKEVEAMRVVSISVFYIRTQVVPSFFFPHSFTSWNECKPFHVLKCGLSLYFEFSLFRFTSVYIKAQIPRFMIVSYWIVIYFIPYPIFGVSPNLDILLNQGKKSFVKFNFSVIFWESPIKKGDSLTNPLYVYLFSIQPFP